SSPGRSPSYVQFHITDIKSPLVSTTRQYWRLLSLTCKRQLLLGMEPVGEWGVAAAGSGGADGLGERASGSGEDDELLGPGDAGVEEVALQHHPGRGRQWDDDGGGFAALGAVDGDGVGVGEFIEFGEVVVDWLVFVGEYGEGLLLE